jgi:hypothetical protein
LPAVAKKVRTPPPPRKVQVPQRRDTRKAKPSVAGPARSLWLYVGAGALGALIIAGAVLGIVLATGGGSSSTKTSSAASYNTLPGVRKTKAPWAPEYLYLPDRLSPLDLTTMGGHNGLVLHFHSHLDIFVNGKRVKVPAYVGINLGGGYLTELHTHNASGVLHIEAQKARSFTLGQFFAEWAVFLNARQVGGYKGLKWYLNGKEQTGNPQNLVFKPHQEIALVIGKPPAKIPSSYKFAPGE